MGNSLPSTSNLAQQKSPEKQKRKIDAVAAYPVSTPKKNRNKSPQPETKKYDRSDILRYFNLPFVNREKACTSLMDSLIEQKLSDGHGLLPILSQHYGSGKTRLVREFRQALKERDHLRHFTEAAETASVANNIMQAVLVELRLNMVTSKTDSIEKDLKFPLGAISRSFVLMLKASIEEYTTISTEPLLLKTMNILQFVGRTNVENLSSEEIEIVTNLKNCTHLPQFLQVYSRYKLYPMLILIDEASSLEYHYKDGHVSFVYLWENLMKPIMGSNGSMIYYPGIYFVVCGTSSTLTKLGRGLLRNETKLISPTNAIHISLEMLKVDHIMEMFEKVIVSKDGKLNVRQFTSIFCNIGDNYEYFCKIVFSFTMGVPRLVVYVLTSLTQYIISNDESLDFSTREKIDYIFDNFESSPVLSLVNSAKEISPFNESTKDKISRFRSILTMGVLGFPIPVTEDFLTEIDLIHDLNVAVETNTVNINGNATTIIKMYIPKFTLIKATKQESLQHLSLLASLPSNYYRYIDKGDLLEQLFLDTILARILVTIKLSNVTTWHNLHPIFSYSEFLRDKKVDMNKNAAVVYLPKIVTTKTKPSYILNNRHPWECSLNYSYWNELHSTFMTTAVIGHPAPKSKSPDIVISVPDGESMIGIACKHYNFSSMFSLKMLQDEIDKASLLDKKITLFVFATQLNATLIKSCKDLGYVKLTEGKWLFGSELTCEKLTTPTTEIRAKGSTFIENTINVYNNMEVIILGDACFSSLFIEQDIELLKEISTVKTYPKMQLIENWVQSFIK